MAGMATTIALLILAYIVGQRKEKAHYRSIHEREQAWTDLITINFQNTPHDWEVEGSELVMGSVVVSLDYFKRFVAGLRGIAGGRITNYETLLDRARREALLRMKQAARAQGYDAVINTRLETSRLASGQQDGKGTAGVEVLAFGTAIKIKNDEG